MVFLRTIQSLNLRQTSAYMCESKHMVFLLWFFVGQIIIVTEEISSAVAILSMADLIYSIMTMIFSAMKSGKRDEQRKIDSNLNLSKMVETSIIWPIPECLFTNISKNIQIMDMDENDDRQSAKFRIVFFLFQFLRYFRRFFII